MEKAKDADQFLQLLAFLCARYKVDRKTVFVEYSSRPPPPLKGERLGYYEGLLSVREKNGHTEFLITVFKASRQPLLTLAHEFAHLVRDLKSGNLHKRLAPPDDEVERLLDEQARKDLAEFQKIHR
jgi:hypothetical protein